ncbi:MAG: DNA repair protein RadA [Alphaproteobacteria bacterium]
MAKPRSQFVCQACGSAYPKWAGRCDGCGEWDTLVEEAPAPPGAPALKSKGRATTFEGLKGTSAPPPRMSSGLGELNRVLGGGFVAGSATLIGGDPGIGKSTLLLQAAAAVAKQNQTVFYVTGEESLNQVRLRGERLGVEGADVSLAAETDMGALAAALETDGYPALLVIDSIQTMFVGGVESAPGSVGQVRASAQALIRLAKARNMALVLVGHVTKDGQIAGPRVLEHMVDTVLYFEGDRGHQYRILRAVKNRFGATDEIGVFAMGEEGLAEVENPSALFLDQSGRDTAGAAVFAGMEGTRPLLVEVQALAAPTSFGTPRRAVVGWDSGRLSQLLAVLEARGGASFGDHDVYLNMAGGIRVMEPAADLAAAAALMSALTGKALDRQTVFFGEVGLSGDVRPVGHTDQRLKEAAKLGFKSAVVAEGGSPKKAGAKGAVSGLKIRHVAHISDLDSVL